MSKLKKRDILFILGDFLFDSDKYDYYVEQLAKMSCRIKLVLGNHDSMKLYKETRIPGLEIQLPLFSYKNYWISHCPIHAQEIRNRYLNIHGHLHSESVMTCNENGIVPDLRYFNVNIEDNNFKFVEFDKIVERKNLLVEFSP